MNVHVTQFAEGLVRRGFTVDEVYRMAEIGVFDPDERFELIGGEIVPLSPKSIGHELLKNWIDREFTLALGRSFGVGSENDAILADNSLVVPDVLVYEPSPTLKRLTPDNILLAVEVANTSLQFDKGRKAQLYAACGMRELWVVDVGTLTTTVHRTPSPTGYRSVQDIPADREIAAEHVSVALRMSDYAKG